jgi:hypothetical protein
MRKAGSQTFRFVANWRQDSIFDKTKKEFYMEVRICQGIGDIEGTKSIPGVTRDPEIT